MANRNILDGKIASVTAVFIWTNRRMAKRERNDSSALRAAAGFLFMSAIFLFLSAPAVIAQTIRVNPTGVNVNTG